MQEPPKSTTFLTVEEAAATLGTSRLRVREAVARGLLTSRRDNEGRLRVDVPLGQDLMPADGQELEADAILSFLFDDIEELESEIGARDAKIAQLMALLARQDEALDRSERGLDALETDKARLAEMLDRAFSHLDTLSAREARIENISERAMTALEAALARAEAGEAHGDRLATLLDRAVCLAEEGDGTKAVADRSLGLLEQAMAQAEAAQEAHRRNEALLERSLQAGEVARRDAQETGSRLASREQSLEKTLALTERAAALTEQIPPAPRKGFLRRLLGL
ncbi:MAG: hypothetical protein AAGF79_00905 [Pseudomonadota bacterium]